MRMKILLLMMIGCVCIAIVSIERPQYTNIDELARGQPVLNIGVVANNVVALMPSIIELNRKTRDVDVSRYNISNYKYKSSKNEIAGNKTSPSYPDRVGWRSEC